MAFPSHGITHRPTVTGTRGMVASAHPLASLAGARILLQGGNAFDAIVAVASTLNVVEPYMSGIAGNGYMLTYNAKEKAIRVLDYMGTSPYQATLGVYSTPETKEIGIRSGMVPGACGGWLALLEQYGSRYGQECLFHGGCRSPFFTNSREGNHGAWADAAAG